MDYARRLRRIPPGVRADLLRVLESDSRVRADVSRQFHERRGGEGIAELLIDLEGDELLRLQVVGLLREPRG
jgi:hypothetical protein